MKSFSSKGDIYSDEELEQSHDEVLDHERDEYLEGEPQQGLRHQNGL